MLSRFVLYAALLLLGWKLLARVRFRELGRRLDKIVNATLVAIVVVYSAELLYIWLAAK
ncbi:MAG TPA: hypothetical protein VFQ35_17055 [Polyangiaceae bacterium]|nr:hypothetical protein [Polyangiaceae bacterium]